MCKWWKEIFEENYLIFQKQRYKYTEKKEVDGIVNLLNLNKEDKILDLCCGSGRHSIEFAQRGFNITALDLSPVLLEEARKSALQKELPINFIKGDMRDISSTLNNFDAVYNIFTSFGFFENDSENRKVLKAIYNCLKPGGKCLLDQVNKYSPQERKRDISPKPKTEKGIELNRVTNFDIKTGFYKGTYSYSQKTNNGVESIKSYDFCIKLYTDKELSEFFSATGFSDYSFYGDWDGSKFDLESTPRMISIAIK